MNSDKLLNLLNYKFNNLNYLKEALTHPSLKKNNKIQISYERLELLGDSILSAVITEYLINTYKDEDEGKLSKRKNFLVSKEALSQIAINKLNLGEYILLSKGEYLSGGKTNINNLENCLEAIIGAIFLDSNYEKIKKVVLNLWVDYISDCTQSVPKFPKMELQEWSQEFLKILPTYITTEENFDNKNNLVFKTKLILPNFYNVEANGLSKKESEKKAAEKMLEYVKKNVQIG